MKKMKRFVALFLLGVMLAGLCACGSKLSGTYENSSRSCSIEFEKDGSCVWYQYGTFFYGTYKKTNDGYQLNINGNGFYGNTVFYADLDGDVITISGGDVLDRTFYKK